MTANTQAPAPADPTRVYALDTEEYYDAEVSVEVLGPWLYHQHPLTRAYLVSVAGTDGTRYAGPPEGAPWAAMAGAVWVSHNAPFDQLAYIRLGCPGGGPAEWHCTANLAAYLQAPRSLAGACKELLGVTVDKSVRDRMKGVRYAELMAFEQEDVCRYAQADADNCLALWVAHSDKWPEEERWASWHTGQMFMRGLPLDAQRVAADYGSLLAQRAEAEAGIPWAAANKGTPLCKKELDKYCRDEGLPVLKSLAKDDKDFLAWLDTHSAQHPVVGHMRTWRSVNNFTLKLETLVKRSGGKDVYHGDIRYYGAQPTGRWSGKSGDDSDDAGYNPLNLPRVPMFGVDFRAHLRAPAGFTFVSVDLSQIEPRCLHLLAGNDRFVSKLREGWNPYEAFAIARGDRFERGTLKKAAPQMYSMYKAMLIGLGYQMGAKEFVTSAPALTGGDYRPTLAECERAVSDFRRREKEVVGLWSKCDADLREHVGGQLDVELPSGRVMRYFDLKIEGSKFGQQVTCTKLRGGKRRYAYHGGKLVENICQGVARDILLHGLQLCEDAGIDIRLHVYDEAVALCPTKDAQSTGEAMVRLMTTPPPWLPDIPLAADPATISEVYCK